MLLRESQLYGEELFLYLERYVNRGSPSGFSSKYTTSLKTSSKSKQRGFFLAAVEVAENITRHDFGASPEFLRPNILLIHPDMANDRLLSTFPTDPEFLFVSPTSSERTVRARNGSGWFYKLTYRGLIGRVERQLAIGHAKSAVEITRVIDAAFRGGKLPKSFHFLREVYGRVFELPDGESRYEWGFVIREPQPYPPMQNVRVLCPAFSLFSPDDSSPTDPLILHQMIEASGRDAADYIFEELIQPTYDAYFTLLLKCGLQLEAHAQNILFALDEDLKVVGVVARDGESIDRDLSLIEDFSLDVSIDTDLSYKCLKRGQYNYEIMHSFMFDFKLGEYLIWPIIQAASDYFNFSVPTLIDRIKNSNNKYIAQLPADFFPSDGKWYSYANIVHDRSAPRPYVGNPMPRFR